jgi:aspartate/methionine/tyrosine aminotransferase
MNWRKILNEKHMMNENVMRVATRMSHIAPFEVMEISSRARALEAEGHDVIHMEVGEPDFATPKPIVEAAQWALSNQAMSYTASGGALRLREKISAFYAAKYSVDIAPQRIVVTAGSSAALLLTFGVLLNADDEVLMADPGYPCNRHFVRTMGGVPSVIPVDAAAAYQLTASDIDRHWSARTVAALIASPSNPTGTVVSPSQMQQALDATGRRGGSLIVDEIYQGLTYGIEPSTALSLDGADDCFVINSFSKYFQMTGWRLGWVVAPAGYVRHLEVLAQNLFISPPAPAQYAAMAAFEPETIRILESRRAEFHARRDFLVPALESIGFRVPVVPEGAFYVYADVSNVASDSFVLARRILEEAHVAVTPGKDFGTFEPSKHIRIAYTQPIARLDEAVSRIGRLLGA